MFRVNFQHAIVARSDRNPCGAIDSGGEDEAAVVVGMFADEVGAAGRAENTDGRFMRRELAAEGLPQVSEWERAGHSRSWHLTFSAEIFCRSVRGGSL